MICSENDKPFATPDEIEEIRYLMIVAKMKQNLVKMGDQDGGKTTSVLSRRRADRARAHDGRADSRDMVRQLPAEKGTHRAVLSLYSGHGSQDKRDLA